MRRMFSDGSRFFARWVGLAPIWCLALVLGASIVGAVLGLAFPKYSAFGALQTSTAISKPLGISEFKAFFLGYASRDSLRQYFESNGLNDDGSLRLRALAEGDGFWSKAVAPILPFEKKDQKEFGDLKDAASSSLLGISLSVDARSPELAEAAHKSLVRYVRDSLVRERIRSWVVAGASDTAGVEAATRAELVRVNNEMKLAERRVSDMRALIAKYPDSKLLDARQLIPVGGQANGAERYLSPMAQLVGAESAISSAKEQVLRLERDLRIKQLSLAFYRRALAGIEDERSIVKLFQRLDADVSAVFSSQDGADEAEVEAKNTAIAVLEGFKAFSTTLDVRNGASVEPIKGRSPSSLAAVFGALAVGVLVAIGLVRYGMAHAESQRDDERDTVSR